MHPLLSVFIEILLHRRGPEDLPASRVLLNLSVFAYLMAGLAVVIVARRLLASPLAGILEVLVEAVFLGLWFFVLLSVFGKRGRLGQTLTAAFGVNALLGILFLPVAALILEFQPAEAGQPVNPALMAGLLMYIGLLVWTASVMGHITSRALDVSFFTGLGYGVLFVALDIALMSALFST